MPKLSSSLELLCLHQNCLDFELYENTFALKKRIYFIMTKDFVVSIFKLMLVHIMILSYKIQLDVVCICMYLLTLKIPNLCLGFPTLNAYCTHKQVQFTLSI